MLGLKLICTWNKDLIDSSDICVTRATRCMTSSRPFKHSIAFLLHKCLQMHLCKNCVHLHFFIEVIWIQWVNISKWWSKMLVVSLSSINTMPDHAPAIYTVWGSTHMLMIVLRQSAHNCSRCDHSYDREFTTKYHRLLTSPVFIYGWPWSWPMRDVAYVTCFLVAENLIIYN